jgi:DNA-binding NarL/FixJ family response regulator
VSALLITADLACLSSVTGGARRSGIELRTAASPAAALAMLAEMPARLIVLDLGTRNLAVGETVPRIRELVPDAAIMAFGPHVHENLLAAARAAGCTLVVSRGQFHSRMDEYLTAYGGDATSGP